MLSLISSLLPGSDKVAEASSTSGSHVTDAPPLSRAYIGPAAQHLQRQMLDLYWAGVRDELPHILLTLRQWQQRQDFAAVRHRDETELAIHGYDTFLDQVSHSSRTFSKRHAARPANRAADHELPTYEEALEDRGWDLFTEMKSNQVRGQLRAALANRPVQDVLRRRARMLLQSAQFLDVDKIIEYREPERLLKFWKRPAPPQVVVSSFDETHMPVFRPLRCVECHAIVRGSTFGHVQDEGVAVCEGCYRSSHYGHKDFTKAYKTCCLPRAITPNVSRQVCHCSAVPRRDMAGRRAALWPLRHELGRPHVRGGVGRVNCGLFELTDMVAEAKYAATRIKAERETTLEARRREETAGMREHLEQERPAKLKNINTSAVPEFGSSFGLTTDSPEQIPFYVRSITDRYPYGNVHMALRVGPLVIENGVENTHGGVLITRRNPPHLQILRDPCAESEYSSLLLTGRTERKLYSQHRPRTAKRYKAVMKQIVGGAFCSFFDEKAENDVIDALIKESRYLVDEGISASDKAALLDQGLDRLMDMLRGYLCSRITAYLSIIAMRLLDPEVDLRWNFQTNNCQAFCDNIIDRNVFGSLLAPHAVSDGAGDPCTTPLYLMSFVCRPGAYVQQKATSKFEVPNGLTEEYLLKFRYGRHDESDLIDSLAEYWYDWGNFEGPVYPYQDVFPWDCTEAYCRYPVKCGECNISKHVLAFPFDSWSIISLHLYRGRELYPRNPRAKSSAAADASPATNALSPGHMSDLEWFINRMTILLAQDVLMDAAVAMARCGPFRESTLWLHRQPDERQDRLKLGGIHRAQPFSHHFEKGAYHQYFVADWASLARPLRVAAYERLRDWRATRTDVGKDRGMDDGDGDGGGCGSCGGFGCGVYAHGCAAGCEASGQDSCGSNCVSSCGSGCGSCGGCGGCGGCG